MVKEKNTKSMPEVCEHSVHGFLMRKPCRKNFRPADKKQDCKYRYFNWVDEADIPREMIRLKKKPRWKKPKFECKGCGKMFEEEKMDDGYCRGFNGCSVEREIEQMRRGEFVTHQSYDYFGAW